MSWCLTCFVMLSWARKVKESIVSPTQDPLHQYQDDYFRVESVLT